MRIWKDFGVNEIVQVARDLRTYLKKYTSGPVLGQERCAWQVGREAGASGTRDLRWQEVTMARLVQ